MKVVELLENVKHNISVSHTVVAERVIAELTEEEVSTRVAAFKSVLSKLRDLQNAAKKIKPDVEYYPVSDSGRPNGEPVLSWSKAKRDELKKNEDDQKKLSDALDRALEGDFSKVKELASK